MSASILSFACSGFDVWTENNQIALIIIQPIWNSHFLRLLFVFDAAIFFDRIWTKNKLMWTCPP